MARKIATKIGVHKVVTRSDAKFWIVMIALIVLPSQRRLAFSS